MRLDFPRWNSSSIPRYGNTLRLPIPSPLPFIFHPLHSTRPTILASTPLSALPSTLYLVSCTQPIISYLFLFVFSCFLTLFKLLFYFLCFILLISYSTHASYYILFFFSSLHSSLSLPFYHDHSFHLLFV